MSEPTPDVLAQRLDRLERVHRRWKIIGSIVGALLALLTALNFVILVGTARSLVRALSGADSEEEETVEAVEEVRARRFVLVDEGGAVRAMLAMRPDGSVALAFSDEKGNVVWKAP